MKFIEQKISIEKVDSKITDKLSQQKLNKFFNKNIFNFIRTFKFYLTYLIIIFIFFK